MNSVYSSGKGMMSLLCAQDRLWTISTLELCTGPCCTVSYCPYGSVLVIIVLSCAVCTWLHTCTLYGPV